MATEEPTDLTRRYLREAFDERNPDVVDELFSPDYVGHWFQVEGGDADREGLRRFLDALHRGFSDLEATVEYIHGDDEYVTVGLLISGTHDGEFMGIAPTGTTGRPRPAIVTQRFEDGAVVESWAQWDALGLLQDLGVLPEDVTSAAPSADD